MVIQADHVFVTSCSVTKSCPTLCNPMDPRTLSLGVFSDSCPLNQWCYLTISFSVTPSTFLSIRVFTMSWLFASGNQKFWSFSFSNSHSNEYSGVISLGLTDLISLQSKGLSRSSPAPQFESINSLVFSILYGPTLTSIYDCWKNQSFDYMDIFWQSDVSAF